MALRGGKPLNWPPTGLTDAVDGTESFRGALNLQTNLIPAQNQKGVNVARPAALPIASLTDYGGGPISSLFTSGDMCYGMYPSVSFAGRDRPFAYNMATGAFAPISGLSNGSLPLSPPASGAWQPPTIAQIGTRILFTHPGFHGGSTANTFWLDSVGNSTTGSNTLTGYPFYYGVPVGTILSDNTGVIPSGTTVVSQTIQNINVLASGTAGASSITVASATGIFPGQPVFLPNGQWDTVNTVVGTTVSLNNITVTSTFTNVNVTFDTSVIVMSNNATASNNNLLIAATSPVSNKFGWLDVSGFSTGITGNIPSNTQPIINGFFNIAGIEPGMTVTGANIAAGTTVRAVGSLVFNVTMTTTTGSTSVSNIQFSGPPSPASYLAGTLQPGQSVQGPGLPPGTTFVTIFGTIANPFGHAATGSVSVSANPGVTNGTFVVSSTFIILSQLPTGIVNGASFTIAGGTAAAPLWGSGDLQGLALANVPVFVSEYGGSACFGVNTTSPQTAAVVVSDAGIPCQCTFASQVLTFGNAIPVTAGYGLPLQNQLGGVAQSLIVFQGASNLQQISGYPTLGNVSVNTSQVATGTLAPNSIASTPKGLMFVAPDGIRLLDFEGKVSDPLGIRGDGISIPFQNATVPSRIAASFSGNVYRATVTWLPPTFAQSVYGKVPRTDDFWLHLDTGKFSGPHTCTVDVVRPWQALNSFICGLQQARGQLWRSDPNATPSSVYVENASLLSWTLRSALLPDDADDEANALVESSVWGSMNKGTSWAASLIDDQSQTQTTAKVAMAGNPVTQSVLPLYWGAPAAFRQASIQLTGPSEPQTLVGSLHLRYQKLRYPLPAFPSYQQVSIVAAIFGANVIDFGADPTGSADCSAAFAAALATSNYLLIPPGTYFFSNAFNLAVSGNNCVQFLGAGAESTVLLFASGKNGINVVFSTVYGSIKFNGFTLATQGAGGSTVGLSLSQSGANGPVIPNDILQDLVFRGSGGLDIGVNYWGTCISSGARSTNYISCIFCGNNTGGTPLGNGVNLLGAATSVSIVHNFTGCNFWALNIGLQYGSYVQGVTVSQCNFTVMGPAAISVPTGVINCDQLNVTSSQFGGAVAPISILGPITNVSIIGNYLLPNTGGSSAAMSFSSTSAYVICGNCLFGDTTQNGILINNYVSRGGIISGNNLTNFATGVWLLAASQFVNVQANVYTSCGTKVLNSGTNNTVGTASL